MNIQRSLWLFFFVLALTGRAVGEEAKNLLSAKAGARVVASSSNYEGSWDVTNLIDDSDNWSGVLPCWCTAEGAPFPHWVVIELPASSWFTTLIFNNAIPDEESGWPGISAKDVQVQVSDKSAQAGFRTVVSFRLERNKNHQEVRLEPVQGRWMKLIVTANWGHESYTELGKLGAFDDGSRPTDISSQLKSKGYVDIYGIYFDFGSANLRTESGPILEKIVAFMKGNPAAKVVIEGHTDNVGDAAGNQRLSEQRATSVIGAIAKQGIDTGRLTAVGYGATKPVGDNSTITGRAKNRRVTLRLMK
jgi:outer membrane protein OmpA-like peptidoglycan-associated protein